MEVSMKRSTLFLLVILSSLPSYAADITFIRDDWQKARSMAAEQQKMLLVDFYTDWCSWCRVMDTTTFRDPAVAEYINEHFIALSIDAERGFGITVAMKYRVNAYPTYGYFTPDGRMVTKSLGYQPPEEYILTLRDAVARFDSGAVLEGVTPETDLDFPPFFRVAQGPKKERKNPDQAEIDAYLAAQTDLFAEVPFSVICRFQTTDKVSDFVLANSDRYRRLYGEADLEMKISSIIADRLRTAIREGDPALLDSVLALSDRFEKGDRDRIHERYLMRYYSGTKDWKKYAGMVTAALEADRMSEGAINSAAWTIYESCDDASVVKDAVGWMEKIIREESAYAYLDTYAAILYKAGERRKAEEMALKAIEKGKSDRDDVSGTEDLLAKIREQVQ